ncbi:cation-transporting P-type ATPase [Phaeobacter gallaeciensis]|uniref:cation-translocating P-type ATPase n=1 Tax=Phaeobacter gallaeciensis TaxID=60890 RepID=UPI00237FBA5C|nr:cation-transporting P-type ATPase [Phaeobacter gallaeciensis]MDE4305020.1 cation-transporting P-type ATPase [Phaeobacter gallaeciensis]MDE4309368.1 cation-transporting P-type ATPase [Phaeobacter gallaeciensis]MDE4313825.1 cation-transporting P-type ATPase [Phaeobacter gallaeciensis]MDE4318197.1 cation-transporting P-type ATPase [Phaeobacter gallaeciensis]MDE4323311.1 cation-transporting P-type ATPase [Phaeobacter gallaeciensis]
MAPVTGTAPDALPFALPAADVAAALACDPTRGLNAAEVAARRARHGRNQLRAQKPQSALLLLAHQFRSIIIWLLAMAAGLSFAFGDIPEGLAILVVILFNGAIGFFTEFRAVRSMEALLRIAEVRTLVRRDGRVRRIDARALVPGDIVILDAGDIVTADLRLLQASNLQSDESILTGESLPVSKSIDPVAPEAGIPHRHNMVFKGTAITRGAGEAIVVATGMTTEIGQISALTETAEAEISPLERRLDRLGHRLVWLTLALAALMIAAGVLRGHALIDMIRTGTALAVAAVPEGLPIVATLCLARGMWRMAAHNALITRLSSVETLGATTLILTDKTGTLTENKMAAVRYLFEGAEVRPAKNAAAPADDRFDLALRIGVLCNNAETGNPATGDSASGEPMEVALLHAAQAAAMTRAKLEQNFPQVAEHAFDPEHKMMASVNRAADGDRGGFIYAIKGAPEAVIEACDTHLLPDGPAPLDGPARQEWAARQSAAAREGLRLLALAIKHSEIPDENPYQGLTLVGLVCFLDPLRADVPDAIRASLAAGVRVAMITGDHADTAATIARDAGLTLGDLTVIEGDDLRDFDPDTADFALRDRVLAADVFARVAPETKLTLVRLFQQAGHVVAMTGDGVNDAPALKKSDIGIAMGKRGTQVAREAADVVLKDDAFGTLIEAMWQGRVIFENIRKFVVYLMSCNVSEVLVVGIAVGAGLPAPLLPLQILFLNLVTDVFPAFALGLGKGDRAIMSRPPRDPSEPIAGRPEWALIGVLSLLITGATLSGFALALYWLRLETGQAITVAFVTLALAQLWNVFNVRGDSGRQLVNDVTGNPYIWAALALCAGLLALALWLPSLSALLDLPDPGLPGLGLAAALSLVPLIAGQILLLFNLTPGHDREQGTQPSGRASLRGRDVERG